MIETVQLTVLGGEDWLYNPLYNCGISEVQDLISGTLYPSGMSRIKATLKRSRYRDHAAFDDVDGFVSSVFNAIGQFHTKNFDTIFQTIARETHGKKIANKWATPLPVSATGETGLDFFRGDLVSKFRSEM